MHHWQQQRGAAWIDHDGWETPEAFTTADREATAVRTGAGLADLSWMTKLDLKGPGVSRPVALGLEAGVWALGPQHALVTCEPSARSDVLAGIEGHQGAGADRSSGRSVYVTDVTSVYAQMLVCGPRCREVFRTLTSLDLSERAFPNRSCGQAGVAHVNAIVLRNDADGLLAFHVLVSREYAESVCEAVVHAGHEYDLVPFGRAAQRVLRV